MPQPITAGGIIRSIFAVATIAFAVLGLVFRGDPRWFVASGACGTMWLAWDLLRDHLARPLGAWVARLATEGTGGPPTSTRPSLDETVRYLESHLRGNATRQVQVNAAVRLEEIYRLVYKDVDRARAVIRLVRARFPGAAELERYGEDGGYTLGTRENGRTAERE
jgi:hypothetical protein